MNGSASPPPDGPCPDRDALFAFNVGRLPAEAWASLADHVGTCTRCLATLESFDDHSDADLAELRRPVPAEPFAAEARGIMQRLVAKLGDLPGGTVDSPSERPTLRLEPGQWGDYEILETLGQGGMGTVYKALQKRLGKPEAPAALAAVLGRMLAKQPDARPATPAAVAEALEPFTTGCDLTRLLGAAGGAAAEAVAAAKPPAPSRPSARRRWLLAAALALAALAAAIVGGVPWLAGMVGLVQITTMTIHHWSGHEPRTYLGVLGSPSAMTQFRDLVRVESRLSRPGYCYLIVYKPDGRDELCYPRSDAARTRAFRYPPDEDIAYCLNDGVGMQAFILIAARQPLPPYADWRRPVDSAAWQRLAADIAWSFDGQDFVPLDGRPRGEQPLHPRAQPFEAVCRELQASPGVEAIRGVVFPVRAQPPRPNP